MPHRGPQALRPGVRRPERVRGPVDPRQVRPDLTVDGEDVATRTRVGVCAAHRPSLPHPNRSRSSSPRRVTPRPRGRFLPRRAPGTPSGAGRSDSRDARGEGRDSCGPQDEGKETALLATINVYRTPGLAARPRSSRRILGRMRLSCENGGHGNDRTVRAGTPRDRRDADRGRRRQGRAPGGAVADRRCGVPAGFCVTTDAFRLAVARTPSLAGPLDRLDRRGRGRPGGAPDGRRRGPSRDRADRPARRRRGGGRPRAGGARRGRRVRRALQRDGGGPADRLVRGPAGHLPQRGRRGRGAAARQPLLGLAVHRPGGDLPAAARHRRPRRGHGSGGATDGLPGRGRGPLHRRPGHRRPDGGLRGGGLRPGRGPGLRPGEPGRVHGARRRGRRPGRSEPRRGPCTRCPAAAPGRRRSTRRGRTSRR